MKKSLLASLLALTIISSSTLHADEVIEQMTAALKFYQERDYKGALEELEFISAQLKKLNDAENNKLLPEPLEGWKLSSKKQDKSAQAAMAMFGLGGGGNSANMQADYIKGKQIVEIKILTNSPLLSVMSMTMNNPAVIANDPDAELYRYKRIKGVKKKDGKEVEITLMIAGQIMLQVIGTNLKDETVLEQYLDGIDIKELKSSLL